MCDHTDDAHKIIHDSDKLYINTKNILSTVIPEILVSLQKLGVRLKCQSHTSGD